MNSLNLNKRDDSIPNNAKKIRRQGKVPGILYGKKLNELVFEVGEIELCREIAKNGEHGIVNLNLNGKEHKALIKEVQRDPVTHKIIHLDLEELDQNKKIISTVPIYYEGEGLLNKKGMVLQKEKDSIKVECTADNLPKYIKINIDGSNNGYVYRAGDLELASELSIIDDLNTVIAAVTYERKTVSDNMEIAQE
ncbi:MAG: 50S ribosomal protein L25 [Clostridium sp.]|uniref:50S ribosomal protein L25 n=1 Tax=Clostridium sp. TaxID=1506 RepID=UPI00280A52C6|nr:50S ribosomal protein L25 [Clostridium sp.]MCI6693112.1 50S ribosomal protein L25 [Clostridium sp.]MDY2629800.1 50S ribosomal protein L25 [Clostridium sp.]